MPEPEGPVIFASDFHLAESDPARTTTFCAFIDKEARRASALYILGDLFDLWIGPAQLRDPGLQPAFNALRELSVARTRVVLLHGNRDFLLSRSESRAFRAEIPGASCKISLGGREILLTHGDEFCSRDRPYQRMKAILRSAPIRCAIRVLPAPAVRALAGRLRRRSKASLTKKPKQVTALNLSDVEARVRAEGLDIVICGHVHSADDRALEGGGRLIVLPGWSARSGAFAVARGGRIELEPFQPE